ncbi:hypothetical protein [Mycolicibacterium helvum]|nr:hypothetical protein [Mycolicibacterium helvum]
MTSTTASGNVLRHKVLATMAGAITGATVLGGAVAHAEPPALPSAEQLTNQVSVIFDVNADRAQRASFLEAGDAALPVVDIVGGPIAQHRSMVSMRVENPTLDGDHLSSQLVMSVMGMGAQRRPLDWVEQDRTWKLSTASLCSVYTEISRTSSCPV